MVARGRVFGRYVEVVCWLEQGIGPHFLNINYVTGIHNTDKGMKFSERARHSNRIDNS